MKKYHRRKPFLPSIELYRDNPRIEHFGIDLHRAKRREAGGGGGEERFTLGPVGDHSFSVCYLGVSGRSVFVNKYKTSIARFFSRQELLQPACASCTVYTAVQTRRTRAGQGPEALYGITNFITRNRAYTKWGKDYVAFRSATSLLQKNSPSLTCSYTPLEGKNAQDKWNHTPLSSHKAPVIDETEL